MIFVCMTLIGVKSKYGSCSGNCTGLININNISNIKIKYPFRFISKFSYHILILSIKN